MFGTSPDEPFAPILSAQRGKPTNFLSISKIIHINSQLIKKKFLLDREARTAFFKSTLHFWVWICISVAFHIVTVKSKIGKVIFHLFVFAEIFIHA